MGAGRPCRHHRRPVHRVYLASDSAVCPSPAPFARIAYSGEDTSRTPLFFRSSPSKADGSYANTGDVVMEEDLRYLEDVTVTTPFTITRYPVDTDLYTTTPSAIGRTSSEVTFHIPE